MGLPLPMAGVMAGDGWGAMSGEDRDRATGVRNQVLGGRSDTVVQAGTVYGGVHIHQAARDERGDIEDPIIATVERRPGGCLADLVVEADPPRAATPSGTVYVVTLEARTTRAVVLRGARPVVLSRRPPRPACLMPRIGAKLEPRRFTTDLGVYPPQLRAVGLDFPFTVSATDVEQFWFEPVVRAEEVYWQLELDWTCAGHRGTTVINDNGAPFEAYPWVALFAEDGSHSVLHSGCTLMRHQPGCPASRVDVAPAPLSPAPIRVTDAEDAHRAALYLYAAMSTTDPDDPASWPDYRQLTSHLQMLLSRTASRSHESEQFRELIVRVLRYLYVSGQYQLGVAVARPLHQDWATALGEDHSDTLALANRLAGCLFGLGESEAARAVWDDVLRRSRRVLGDDHPQVLISAGNLAACLSRLGTYAAARALYEDTLGRSRRVLGDDHRDTLRLAGNLAFTLSVLEEHEAARALREDTLRRAGRVLGEDHPDTLAAAANLALSLRELGEHEAAGALEDDTLERRGRVLGKDHPDTVDSARRVAARERR